MVRQTILLCTFGIFVSMPEPKDKYLMHLMNTVDVFKENLECRRQSVLDRTKRNGGNYRTKFSRVFHLEYFR